MEQDGTVPNQTLDLTRGLDTRSMDFSSLAKKGRGSCKKVSMPNTMHFLQEFAIGTLKPLKIQYTLPILTYNNLLAHEGE